jgi:hypothetical protein
MKPAKKAKDLLISKACGKETRQRLSRFDQADKAERALYDAEAVAEAARRFWKQAQKAFVAAAGVSARERAEAVLDAAKQSLEQSTAAVSTARQALDAALDELIDYNKRLPAKQSGELSAADRKVLNRWADALAADLTFLNRWAEAYRAVSIARRHKPKRRGKVVSSSMIPKERVKNK